MGREERMDHRRAQGNFLAVAEMFVILIMMTTYVNTNQTVYFQYV